MGLIKLNSDEDVELCRTSDTFYFRLSKKVQVSLQLCFSEFRLISVS